MPTRQAPALRPLGRVLRAHGVRGEMKVVLDAADLAMLNACENVWIGASPETAVCHEVTSVRTQHTRKGELVLLLVAGIDDRDVADALRGALVYGERTALPADAEAGVDVDGLVGLVAFAGDERVGTVEDVLDMPAHPVLVLSRDGRPDVLVPAVSAFIETIDLAAGRLSIRPIEGLLDE